MLWMLLLSISVFIALLIAGAFYGTQNAVLIFNSIPFAVFLIFIVFLLLESFFIFPAFSSNPALLLIHAGCFFVLAGSMRGSQTGHQIANRIFGTQKIPKGYMIVHKGQDENTLMTDLTHQTAAVPFSIRLNDFRIEYYNQSQAVKGYYSDVAIAADGKEILTKTISVNHPLHFGGYHIYQYSCEPNGEYAIFLIASDSGLYVVYCGYWMLCIGLIWQLWFKNLRNQKQIMK